MKGGLSPVYCWTGPCKGNDINYGKLLSHIKHTAMHQTFNVEPTYTPASTCTQLHVKSMPMAGWNMVNCITISSRLEMQRLSKFHAEHSSDGLSQLCLQMDQRGFQLEFLAEHSRSPACRHLTTADKHTCYYINLQIDLGCTAMNMQQDFQKKDGLFSLHFQSCDDSQYMS